MTANGNSEKREYKFKYDRIQFIDREVRSGSYPSTNLLARKYETSSKTIQRDIKYLQISLEAPLEYHKSKKGWYYSEPNFFLPALDITESDFFAICVTEKALRLYENTPLHDRLSSIFDKIKAFLPEQIRVSTSWIDQRYTFLQESHTRIDPSIWEILSQGLRLHRSVRIGHHKAGSEESTPRTVDPWHIINYRGEWYLIAYCHLKKEIRRFAVSRITEALLQKETFSIPVDFDFNAFINGSFGIFSEDRDYIVSVCFSRKQSPYVMERIWHPEQKIEELEDGAVTLTFPSTSLFEVRRWVLSWGPDVQVLGPAELKESLREDIEKMKRIYG